MDFAKLYKQNCAACHGDEGKRGLAISLSNPVYIALAGKDAIREATAKGGPGKLMPAFAKSHGGTLTDAQIEVLTDGIVQRWGQAQLLAGQNPPSYAAALTGDAVAGKAAYATYCARCHAAEGVDKTHVAGPITDENYLALISDQGLRTAILAGRPDEGMPDWRSIGTTSLTDQQVTNIVAWLATLRKRSAMQSAPATPATNNPKQGKEISHE
jgi:cytochrome c oxidase cbb3-type subunit 3/ubiquinol-cytochrome c reductase cytochrome c subunit